MSLVQDWNGAPRWLRLAQSDRVVLTAFTITLFFSALLLFAVQPMFARMVLPKLGGSPSVWAVAMCFFQAILLAGYCYAHLLNRYLGTTRAVMVHAVVCALALLALPIGLPHMFGNPPEGDAYFWLFGLFAVGVGIPFFAVSANAPLLQAWFSRSGHPHAGDPYFLYGASNIGSLIALLGYPLLLEPNLGLAAQSHSWAAGFMILIGLLLSCGALTLVKAGGATSDDSATGGTASNQRVIAAPGLRDRLAWIALAAIPSGLVVAVTTHLSTDIASAPFLWVIPLALFLATFILVFRDRPLLQPSLMLRMQPLLLALMLLYGISGMSSLVLGGLGSIALFFVSAMVCHHQLYLRRPDAAHLTQFYLLMSLGGVIGGLFAGLFAPNVFNGVFEYPLLLALALCAAPGVFDRVAAVAERTALMRAVAGTLGGIGLLYLLALAGVFAPGQSVVNYAVIGLAGALALALGSPRLRIVFALGSVLALAVLPGQLNVLHQERNFFGVPRVAATADGQFRELAHGTTIHGAERVLNADGSPVTTAPVPGTYYHPMSPMYRSTGLAREHAAALGRKPAVGVVGLGAGSLACAAEAGENWKFYEIDPAIVRIARDPRYFSFMSRCQPNAPVIVGDARLKLADEPAGGFDLLIIDAFSSDSIPVHLLTREAMQLYRHKLADGGLLVMHISNRHMDLAPIVGGTAASLGLNGVLVAGTGGVPEKRYEAQASVVAVLSGNDRDLDKVRQWPGASLLPKGQVWTDDFSDVLGALLRKAGW